jgi:hypothetical protein
MVTAEVEKRFSDLVALALDDAASENERRNAAMSALLLLKDNDLMLADRAELREMKEAFAKAQATVEGVRREYKKKKQEADGKALLFALGGFLLGSKRGSF